MTHESDFAHPPRDSGPRPAQVLDELDQLVALSAGPYPQQAVEAAKVIVAHNLAVALSARSLVGDLLEEPERWDDAHLDLCTGRRIDAPTAITRNAQLIHALGQDDTHFAAMTHVGATTLPLLFSLGETHGASTRSLVEGFAAAVAAAEILGRSVSPEISGHGIRPTSVMGPTAAVVGAGRMLGWDAERVRRAIARTAATAYGTQQTWIEGTQDWLHQVASVGLLAWQAARSSASAWDYASDPFWGLAGLFTSMGASRPDAEDVDRRLAATRSSLKRFPVCAISQVPLTLVAEVAGDGGRIAAVDIRMAPPFAATAGIGRTEGLDSPTRRLMSTSYAVAVMAAKGSVGVADLAAQPTGVDEDFVKKMAVISDEALPLGAYALTVRLVDGREVELRGDASQVGSPVRAELDRAARVIAGVDVVEAILERLDLAGTSVSELLDAVTS